MKRRDLLAAGGLALLGATVSRAGRSAAGDEAVAGRQSTVISTWDFGAGAHVAAVRALTDGGTPLDAVENGVRVVEADASASSVGYGGIPNRLGVVELDAAVMEGSTLNIGSVAALQGFKHPVSVARRVMERTDHVLLVGGGARRFALKQEFVEENLLTPAALETWREMRDSGADPGSVENHDTIGMIARAANGELAAACTTSGLALKLPGRVGDSPLIGHGLYCDDEAGGAVATGLGEEVIRVCGSYRIVEYMREGVDPGEAIRRVLDRMLRRRASKAPPVFVGFAALRADGALGYGSTTPGFQVTISRGGDRRVVDAPASTS